MATNSTNSTGSYENSTNSSFSRVKPSDRFNSTTIPVLSLQLLVALVGIIGNIIVCVITSKKRNLKIAGNHFILNLALADLGILVIYYPLHVVSIELSFSWPFGKIACHVIRPFFDIFFGAAICCITAIGFYRYRMLVYCTKPRMNVQAAKRILVVIWLLPFIIVVMPQFWVMELKPIPKMGIWICQPTWPSNWISFRLYHAANNLAFYFFPLAIITSTYVRIRNKLRDNIRRNDSYRQARSRDTARKDVDYRTRHNRRALRLLTPVVVIFAICMAPGVFMTLMEIFSKDPRKTFTGLKYLEELRRFIQLLIVVNSSANPIIYSVVNSEFRRDLARLIRCDKNNYCFTDSTEGLSLSTFRKSSSIGKKSSISFSSFKRRSTSSKRGSKLWSSRNFADKLPAKADQEESFAQSKEEERKGNEEN